MAGGKARQSLNSDAGSRGLMAPKEAHQLNDYIIEWCLRRKQRKILIHNEVIDVDDIGEVTSADMKKMEDSALTNEPSQEVLTIPIT